MKRTFILQVFFRFTEHTEVSVGCSKLLAWYKAQGNGEEIVLFAEHCKRSLHDQCEGCLGYVGRTHLPQGLNLLVLEVAYINELLRRYKLHFM